MSETLTDAIYYASLDPRIQKLRNLGQNEGWQGLAKRYSAAVRLFLESGRRLLIDWDIVILQYDAAQMMQTRVNDGYVFTIAMGFPDLGVLVKDGGLGMDIPRIPPPPGSGFVPYNPEKPWPAGAMISSTDAADFPAWKD